MADMTKLRDKFALGAMQSLLGAYGGDISPEQVSIVAYMVADEMLKVRLQPASMAVPVRAPEPAPAPARAPLIEPRCEQGPHPDDFGFLGFSHRALSGITSGVLNSLERRGVRTIGALTRLTAADLSSFRFKGIGIVAIARIREALAVHGLSLAGEAVELRPVAQGESTEGATAC